MKQVADFEINAISLARIESSWVKKKKKLDLKAQQRRAAIEVSHQAQFSTSTAGRKKVEKAIRDGEMIYAPSIDQANEERKANKKILLEKKANKKAPENKKI